MRIAITGSTGLVGLALASYLGSRNEVLKLTRRSINPRRSPNFVHWEPYNPDCDLSSLEGCDAVIHLAGKSIANQRWNNSIKDEILNSRVYGTRSLISCISKLENKPKALISASAVGYYGDAGNTILTESSPAGNDFLADVVKSWEAEVSKAQDIGMRTASLRFGVILNTHGGAYKRMSSPFRFGLGGTLGDGQQWMSWIMLEDVLAAISFVIEHQDLSGAMNVTSPEPVQNIEFSRVLAKELHRPAFFRVPATVLKIMLGELAEAVLLASQRAVPERLQNAGFTFQFPTIEKAIHQLEHPKFEID